jgi:hypothetical protein
MGRHGIAAALAVAAFVAWWPSPIARSASDEDVLVLVTLRDQPATHLALADSMEAGEPLTPQDRDEASARHAARLMRRLAHALPPSQAGVAGHIAAQGGQVVYAGRAFNAIAARVPFAALDALRARPDVLSVEIDTPRHALLDVVPQSMLASAFWAGGTTGGAVDVATIDTGVYTEHEAFASRASAVAGAVFHRVAQTRSDYYDVPTDPDDYAGHGTLVAGMVFAQGSGANPGRRGIAYGLDKLYNLKAGYAVYPSGGSSLLGDLMEAVDWALLQADPPEVFNYSYGARTQSDDDTYARFWDGVVDSFGKVATISSGNSGPADGTVGSPGIAYNVISVANVASKGTASRTDDAIASSSSRGPTVGGRKKPDISAPGTSIWLPSNYGAFSWLQATGTSFSSPAIAGAAALLMDAGVADPRAVKAVLINTADDLGTPGWDTAYGWGYYNGARAWSERTAYSMDSYGGPDTEAGVRFFERSSAAPTRATLAWHRHVSYATGGSVASSGTLNDLDLYLYGANNGTLRASSTSTKDNVEHVGSDISEPAVLVAESKGTFTGASEIAALAFGSGFAGRLGPSIGLELSSPGTVAPGTTFQVFASAGNPGDIRGHLYTVTLSLPPGYTLTSGGATQNLGSLAPGANATATWTVRAPAAPSPSAPFQVTGSTTSYGWQWNVSAAISVATAAGCSYAVEPPPPISPEGGMMAVEVLAANGCPWSSASGVGWLQVVEGGTGSGSGHVMVSAEPNTSSAERSGTVSVAGIAVAVTQSASAATPLTYYLAEGATGDFFDLSVAIANPNDAPAPASVRFMKEDGSVIEQPHTIAAMSRLTIAVDEIPGLEASAVSTVVESTSGLPLVVERTMTWSADGYGGHGGGAVDAPGTTWYFAEGSQGFFDTYLLLANAAATPATATVTFLLDNGEPVRRTVTVGPTSRLNVYAGDVPELAGKSFSMTVVADAPIIAERAMYWSGGGLTWTGGHESAGVPGPARTWLHAEGATGDYFDMYLLIGNPNDAPATITVRYLLPSGAAITKRYVARASSRITIFVEGEDPALASTAVSATVESDLPVVSERAMYWPGTAGQWQDAHNSFGVTDTALRWGLADGCQGGPRKTQTYILLANPGSAAANVAVTFLPESGSPVTKTYTVAATSRFNVEVGSEAPALAGSCFGALIVSTNGVPIAVERAMYWDARGVTWAAGTNATGVRLPN